MLTAVATTEHTTLETIVDGIAVVLISQLWLAAAMDIVTLVPTLTITIGMEQGYDAIHYHYQPTLLRLVHRMQRVIYDYRAGQMSMKEDLKSAIVVAGHQYVTWTSMMHAVACKQLGHSLYSCNA